VAVGADALRRHRGWSADEIRGHLRLALIDLTRAQTELLDTQIALLAETPELRPQLDLIERYGR
jgi:hypothetical protein